MVKFAYTTGAESLIYSIKITSDCQERNQCSTALKNERVRKALKCK